MVVKSERGRRRYIAFTAPAGAGRKDVESLLDPMDPRPPMLKVVTCYGGWAVVRCGPEGCSRAIDLLSSHGYESKLTSGTLRTIRDRYPETRVPQMRKR